MNELHDLLERATDRVEAPDLAATALAGARRRRTKHRSILAAGVAGILVVGVAVVGQLNGSDTDSTPPVTPPTPTATSTRTDIAEPPWDPRRVDDLPAAGSGIAASLPTSIDPPPVAEQLQGSPLASAVLALRTDDAVLLLSSFDRPDGRWRSVPPPPEGRYGAILTADGTRLAVDSEGGVTVWDLPTGESTSVAFPSGYQPWDYQSWRWIDDVSLLFDDGGPGGWLVNTDSGSVRHVPYPGSALSSTVADEGGVLDSADWGNPARLTDWADGEPRRVDMSGIGRLSSIHADRDTVVGTSYANGPFSVYVVDREDLTPRFVLPVRDFEGNYSNGGLSVASLLDDGTVLLQVAVFGHPFSWRLVAWEPTTDELSLVSRGTGPVPASYAAGLLG